jgi:hypothetical protein
MNTFKSALLLKTFGNSLFVSRMAGVIERLLIASLLFRWLGRIFKPSHAMLASLVTIIISAGDRTDPIASYNHDAIFYAMLSGFSASFVLSQKAEIIEIHLRSRMLRNVRGAKPDDKANHWTRRNFFCLCRRSCADF